MSENIQRLEQRTPSRPLSQSEEPQRLEPTPLQAAVVETVWGVGYVLPAASRARLRAVLQLGEAA